MFDVQNRDESEEERAGGLYPAGPCYIDIFAGCGGLSLGLKKAGWNGLFAIEKDELAFSTLEENFLKEDSRYPYFWPEWLTKEAHAIDEVISEYRENLIALRGNVDLLAGGPPCQGFSSAGRRKHCDPRNQLVNSYLSFVNLVEPKMVLLENVKGIASDFTTNGDEKINFADQIISNLEKSYYIFSDLIRASEFGIPQKRPRFLIFGFHKDHFDPEILECPFGQLSAKSESFLFARGLTTTIGAGDAISDLERDSNPIIPCDDFKGYEAIGYSAPKTAYQHLMRDGFVDGPSDTRLAKHRPHIVSRFADIIDYCSKNNRLNVTIPKELKKKFGIKKSAIRVIDPDLPSPTITSMPDDLLHYSEPRTLTVRENARLQSFPDWFRFKGKYTSGGDRRMKEVPRFTQVANAVPPLLAEQIGACLLAYLEPEH